MFTAVRVRWFLLLVLLALRLPSLVQPAGADQSLYAYIGLRLLEGGAPYFVGWDQKPPGIHVIYAALWAIWPDERVVALADLLAAIGVCLLLLRLGSRLATPISGWWAACAFALLANPSIQRLSGVFVRSQCETFIALAVTAALVLVTHPVRTSRRAVVAGLLLGGAIWLKYPAVVFAVPVLLALLLRPVKGGRPATVPSWKARLVDIACLAAGGVAMGALGLGWLAWHGSLDELWLATITYNIQYSSEPYAGTWAAVQYVLGLPFRQARHDLLWWLGLTGTALAFTAVARWRTGVVMVAWIGAATAAIALNGRDLPQYFVQAAPALALAAGLGLHQAWASRTVALRAILVAVLVAGLVRVGTDVPFGGVARLGGLPDLARNIAFDWSYWRGAIDRPTYLDRFGGARDRDKYIARDVEDLATYARTTTLPDDTIYVFGFSPGVYVKAERRSASRFFWSYPVVIGFESGRRGYGAGAVLNDLQRMQPALIALQRNDWERDSLTFFMADPGLSSWLLEHYTPAGEFPRFAIWERMPDRPPSVP
jgi:hypothetical protein